MLSEQHLVGWDFLCCTGVLLLPILVEWKPLKVPESYVVNSQLNCWNMCLVSDQLLSGVSVMRKLIYMTIYFLRHL